MAKGAAQPEPALMLMEPPGWAPGVQHLPLGDYSNAPVVLLDWQDYQWAIRWRWQWVASKQGRNRKHKVYGRRNVDAGTQRAGFQRRQEWLWLHKEICLRAHGPAPSLFHTIADHRNGQTLDCRRENLRWATPSDNRQNIAVTD